MNQDRMSGGLLTDLDLRELEAAVQLSQDTDTPTRPHDTHMHARLPPMNVIRCEYTPGMCASSTDFGRPSVHRSGRHLSASGPHVAGSRLQAWTSPTTRVPFGTGMAERSVPSSARTGVTSGRTASFSALEEGETYLVSTLNATRCPNESYSRKVNATPGCLEKSGNLVNSWHFDTTWVRTAEASHGRRRPGTAAP